MENYEQIFQERVDELFLMEQRADRRAEKLLELVKSHEASITEINATSDSIQKHLTLCRVANMRATYLFRSAALIFVIVIAGTVWWSRHLDTSLADSRAELASIDTKLKHTPVILKYRGKDFVRVTPDTERGFTREEGGEAYGRYAQVWHVR